MTAEDSKNRFDFMFLTWSKCKHTDTETRRPPLPPQYAASFLVCLKPVPKNISAFNPRVHVCVHTEDTTVTDGKALTVESPGRLRGRGHVVFKAVHVSHMHVNRNEG